MKRYPIQERFRVYFDKQQNFISQFSHGVWIYLVNRIPDCVRTYEDSLQSHIIFLSQWITTQRAFHQPLYWQKSMLSQLPYSNLPQRWSYPYIFNLRQIKGSGHRILDASFFLPPSVACKQGNHQSFSNTRWSDMESAGRCFKWLA